jgi:hypothetical protein
MKPVRYNVMTRPRTRWERIKAFILRGDTSKTQKYLSHAIEPGAEGYAEAELQAVAVYVAGKGYRVDVKRVVPNEPAPEAPMGGKIIQ